MFTSKANIDDEIEEFQDNRQDTSLIANNSIHIKMDNNL